MSTLPELGLVRSADLDEVLAAVDYDHAPYAGGTELVPAMGLGLRRPSAIVDLKRVKALKGIDIDAEAGAVTIGAAVTHRRLSDHPAVREHLPTLAAAASRVGNARVRSTGTVGGNLCFAEPRSDLGCVLVALGATAEIRSAERTRILGIDELIVGAFETSLAPDEILVSVTAPFEPPAMSYWKLQSYERPTLGVALVVTADRWEVTVGAATERPTRVVLAAGDTAGLAAFVEELDLSDDMTGKPAYKRSVLRAHLQRALGADR
jgi:carbon-monoxide dehydrogenase medium subunit